MSAPAHRRQTRPYSITTRLPFLEASGNSRRVQPFLPTPVPPPSLEGMRRITAIGAHKAACVVSVLGKLVSHRKQQPSIRARHRLERLDQPLDRLAQVYLIGDLRRGRLSITLEEQLVGFDFQCFGKFFQSCKRGGCVSAFYTRDVRAQETGPPLDVALR